MQASTFPTDFDTACTRFGLGRGNGAPLVEPIVQSTSYSQSPGDGESPHAYSRVSNPTVDALEGALGQLESAPPAVTFATGLAAETALFLALLTPGDHVICSRAVYGGTTRLLQQILEPLGVTATFVDTTDLRAVRAAIMPATKLLFIETPANPTLDVTDIAGVASIARDIGAWLAVDNTFLTPVLQQPLACGADISVYSTTKFIDGHTAALGGAIVTRDEAILERVRFVRKSTGAIQTPFHAWITLKGLKTLPLRLRRQSETASRIAAWLAQQDVVRRVCYPGLDTADDRTLDVITRQHLGHDGAVVTLELPGDRHDVARALASLELCRFAEHVGSVETLITHPATMTHADVPRALREEAGVTDGLVRLSIGLEDPAAIIADLDVALQRLAARHREVAQCCSQ